MSLITYKSNTRRKLVGLMVFLMINQICFPTISLALTSGPTQPELQSFEPAGASEMVDLFSGDFNYNIPLFELPGPNGGYPVNLFYNSVTNADQEASMVGLGWNIGIGAINRQMRGLPDDFNGEKVKRRVEMKPMTTAGAGITGSLEVIGGDFGKVVEGVQKLAGDVSLGLGFTVMYNSYQGLGFSIDPSVSAQMGPKPGNSGFGLSGNFGLSFNSLQGASANGNVSVSMNGDKGSSLGAGLGLGLNSRAGMNLSLSTSFSLNNNRDESDKKDGTKGRSGMGGSSSSFDLTYNQPAYSPQVDFAFTGFNFSGQIELGGSVSGFDVKGSLKGFYSNRELMERYRETPAYGAMYQQNSEARSLQDFNREKDGAIRFKQPYLPIPSLTADALSVTGHGIGGVYQLYRSDIPFFSDQQVESPDGGFSIGGDIGISITPHFGVNASGNYSVDRTDRPFTHRGEIGAQGYDANNPKFEPYYYKRVGELNAEINPSSSNQYMGGDEPVQLDMNGLDFGSSLKTKSGAGLPNVKGRSERKARSMSIQPITNKELLNTQNQALLPEFDVKYYNVDQETEVDATDYIPSKLTTVNRANHGDDQIAGYTTISDGGARWNFALPARNNVQIDADFSVATPTNPSCAKKVDIAITGQNDDEIGYKVPGTNEYLSLTTLPAYSHAYMLTSIYGADYIDADPSDGAPNNLDKGYWMNIEYAKTSSDYKWRTPFTKATYIQGLVNKTDDDRAMFTYGEREQYHPARMETKTHVAEYHYTKRNDGRGVAKMLQNNINNNSLGDYSYKLTKISIYSKKELAAADAAGRSPIAMKNVHFNYASSADELCKNVENNGVSNGGKLTLESVYFTYENNTRGSLNPYKFEYKNSNADYEELAFDRWGVFRPAPNGNPCYNLHAPFVNQEETPATLNDQVATWHLTDIHLPSGSHIKINVERDQYSHEQDRVAGRIYQIKGVGNGDPNNVSDIGNDRLVSDGNPNHDAMTIYFDLEPNHVPYSPTLHNNDPIVKQEMDRYFEDMYVDDLGKQLYFQVHTDLLNTGAVGTEHYQSLTGYTAIASYGVVEGSHIVNNYYTKGYIQLKPFPIKVEGENYHPFLISAWQFIKSSLTDMMYGTPPASSTDSPEQAFQRLGAVFGEIAGLFRNYYKVAAERNYGTKIDLSRSMIRLASPNQKMYGGGLRVNKVTLHDDWADEITPVYGMVYEYDEEQTYIDAVTQEEKTRIISSGTATATPAIGKQESSLRYAKHFVEDLSNKQDKLHFFEHPLNESYYQGASIGYRKVTVKSLASDYAIKSAKGETPPTELGTLAPGFATSGITVNEFYTAKDFPIITRHTYPDDWTNPIKYVPVPFIGSIRIDQYSGSQGYTVETNNMHGKPFKIANYAQDINGHVVDKPISQVEYLYHFDEEVYTEGQKRRIRKVLNNTVPVLVSDTNPSDPTKAAIENNAEVGVERELFVDVRQKSSRGGHMGVAVNIDVILPVPPVIVGSGWGDMSYSEQVVHTAVTNKVIRKSGILMRTTASDGQSTVITDNKVFDRYTGQPVLTTVNNSYDDLIYNYDIAGHLAYDRMGAAYKNYDLRFEGSIQNKDNTGYYPLTTTLSNIIDHLVEGDEFIIEKGASKTRATLVKKTLSSGGNKLYLAIDATSPSIGAYDFILVRSGRRNHLTASVGSITARSNPTEGRTNTSVSLASQEVSSQGSTTTTNGNYTQSYQTLDDILSISAMTYTDAWDNGDKNCTLGPIAGQNAFRTGDRGIFRAKDTWTYVNNRKQSNPINTQIDGTMDEVPLFNWKNPFLAYSSPYDNWKRTSEITKYNTDGTELETRNIIGIYSSAVYGYENNLPIAVANNSAHHEVGYEGFEEFNAGNVSNALPRENGHILFVDRNTDCSMLTEQFNLVSNLNSASTGVVIDAEHYANFPVPEKAVFNLTHTDGTNFRIEHTIVGVYPYNDPSGKTYVYLEFDTPPVGNAILPTAISASEWTHFKGTANLHFRQNNSNFTNTGILLAITDEEAHTGAYSLSIAHNSEGGVGLSSAKLTLPQNDLLLRADGEKEYVFSAWVRVAGSGFGGILDSYTFDNSLTLTIGGSQIHAAGPIIDGWQRMEGKFTPNQNIATISVTLNESQIYLDDLRVFPSKGNMQSYVYDPVTYRVKATLDNNNYFSRYIYDEQGTLISVQKETPKGVKTIQETGSYVKETN